MYGLFKKKLLLLTCLALVVSYASIAGESGQPMKAIVYHEYGTADVLHLEQTQKPVPNDTQVLIKVRAASVNPLDWHYMRGTPYIMRIAGAGLTKPKDSRIGADLAGVVEPVGDRKRDGEG